MDKGQASVSSSTKWGCRVHGTRERPQHIMGSQGAAACRSGVGGVLPPPSHLTLPQPPTPWQDGIMRSHFTDGKETSVHIMGSLPEYRLLEHRGRAWVQSPGLKQCLAHSRCFGNMCCVHEELKVIPFYLDNSAPLPCFPLRRAGEFIKDMQGDKIKKELGFADVCYGSGMVLFHS